jgi:DNA-binding NarL/FixJ family response regulator
MVIVLYREIETMKKVMIVDNEAIFRKGLRAVLENIGDVEIVAEASNGAEFLELINATEVDMVFMDIKMPVMDGVEATQQAMQKYPQLIIIGFSSLESPYYMDKMMEAGAKGYLTKSGNNYEKLVQLINNNIGVLSDLKN